METSANPVTPPLERVVITAGRRARSPSLPPVESAAATRRFDAGLRCRMTELVTSVSMSPEDFAERADWRQDLHEMAWRSEAPRFLGDERQGAELYPAEQGRLSEVPAPMGWDVMTEVTDRSPVAVDEWAGASLPRSLGQRFPVLALGVAAVAMGVLVGSAFGTVRPLPRAVASAPHPTMTAVGAPGVAERAPQTATDLPEPSPTPIVAPSAPSSRAARAPGPESTARAFASTAPASSATVAPAPEGIPAVFVPTPVAAWLQPPAGAFSNAGAAIELASLAGRARACGAADADGPVTADVHVTFAPSGRATTASVSGPLAGTSVGGCVARVFRGASVPAFDGEAVTVRRTVTLR